MAMSMVPARNHPRESSRTTGLACGVIVLAALAVYYNSISCPFIFDDQPAITQNLTIRHFWSALSPPPNGGGVIGRPLVNFSLAVNYAVGGLKVWGYHATNLAIHILAGLTLFGIVRRTLLRPAFAGLRRASPSAPNSGESAQGPSFADSSTVLAFIVALLWTVHPLQTESVTSIIQRTESLMGLFYLLTLYCFVRGAESRSQASGVGHQVSEAKNQEKELKTQNQEAVLPLSSGLMPDASCLWYSASILSCLLGMASKEVMVSAPLIVLLYDRTFVAGTFKEAWQERRKYYLGLASTWLLLGFLVSAAGGSRGTAAGFGLGITPWTYALTQCRAIIHYLKLAVWPHPLVLDYGTKVVPHLAEVLPQALVLVLLVLATIFGVWRRSALGFVGAWFFAILAPSSSIVPLVAQTVAEHRMYLPLAAVVLLVLSVLYRLLGRRSVYVGGGLAVLLTVLTQQRNKDYRSELSIWNDTAAKCPDNARAPYNLGCYLAKTPSRLPEAMVAYETALRIDPDYVDAHTNLGNALLNLPGRLPDAIAQYEAVLRIKPDSAEAHNNLGTALLNAPGRMPDAIAQYEAALRLNPDFAQAHFNLGIALLKVPGRLPDAIAQYEAALTINPDLAQVHVNLGTALLKMPGRLPDAIAQFEAALRIDPDSVEAHNDLGNALFNLPGRLPDAMAQYETALRINPGSADAHYNLGNVLLKVPGRLSDAIAQYEAALRINPDYGEAHNSLGNALLNAPGRLPDAMAQFQAALRINPDSAEAHNNLGNALAQRSDRLPDSLAEYRTALRLKPDYAEAHYNFGNALFQSSRFTDALGEYESAIRLKPDYAEAHNNLGNALAELGRLSEAIGQYEEALRINPDYVNARKDLEQVRKAMEQATH